MDTTLGASEEGINDYTVAIQLNPAYAEAYNNRGIANWLVGRRELAMVDFSSAIEVSPNYANAYLNRAISHMLAGDQSRAMADLKRATDLGAASSEVSRLRAIILDRLRDEDGPVGSRSKRTE